MHSSTGLAVSLFALALLAACSDSSTEPSIVSSVDTTQSTSAVQANAVADGSCVDEVGIQYLCGIINGEDILQLGNLPLLLVSGMNGELSNDPTINGKLHLVNPADRSFNVIFPGTNPVFAHNTELYGACPGPLDVSNFSVHGLALKTLDSGPQRYRLYITSHGAREAIEIFEIDALMAPLTIRWVGCVPMPATSFTNSVVILNDWGFLATQFIDRSGSGLQGVRNREITGHLFEWHPGAEVSVLEGTELSGPNGIAMTDDERFVYVAASGTREVVRFDRSSTPPAVERLSVDVAPDNIRWADDGTLYTAGRNVSDSCDGPDCGWSVIEVVPTVMRARRVTGADASAALQGASSALTVGNEIWVGTYGGDRLGILPRP